MPINIGHATFITRNSTVYTPDNAIPVLALQTCPSAWVIPKPEALNLGGGPRIENLLWQALAAHA